MCVYHDSLTNIEWYFNLQVSFRKMLCFSWFTFVDMYFSEIAVRGTEKLEKTKDGRYLI
jgi:hypothetical protein